MSDQETNFSTLVWRGALAVGVLAVAVWGINFAWGKLGSEAEAQGPEHRIVEAQVRDLVVEESIDGTLEAATQIDVKADVGGRLQELFVEEGDRVEQGDKLAQIETKELRRELERAEATLEVARAQYQQTKAGDPVSARAATRAELQTARAELKNAKQQYERTKQLHEKGYATEKELEDARSRMVSARENVESLKVEKKEQQQGAREVDLQVARANLEQARTNYEIAQQRIEDATITAPHNGKILGVHLDPGDTVVPAIGGREGVAILTMGQTERILVKGTVGEKLIGEIEEGMPVEFTFSFLPDGETVEGEITKITTFGQPNDQGVVEFPVELEVTGDLEQPRLGSNAEATVVTNRVEEALTVPVQAIQSQRQQKYVEVPVGQKGKETERVNIETGASTGQYVHVTEGLEQGARVIIPDFQPSGRGSGGHG